MSIQSNTGEPTTHYIKVVPAELELHPGQTAQLKAYLVWMDGREEDITEQVRWSTDQPQIGTVTKAGAVTVGVVGNMVVLAQYEGQRTETHIQVTAAAGPVKKKKSWGNRKSLIIGGAIVAVTLIINGVALSQMSGGKGDSASAQPEPAPASQTSESKELPAEETEEPNGSSPASDGDRKDMRSSLFGFAKEKAVAAIETASSLSGQGKELVPSVPPMPQPELPAEQAVQPPAEAAATPSPAATAETAAKAAPPTVAKKEAAPRPKKESPKKQSTPTPSIQPQPQPAKPSQVAAKPAQPKPQPKAAPAPVLVPVQQNGKWGYVKQINPFDKELAIAYQFDHATSFSEGLAVVKKGGKFGYINAEGSLVIDCQYEYATPFKNGVATVKQNGKLIQIDKTGAVHK